MYRSTATTGVLVCRAPVRRHDSHFHQCTHLPVLREDRDGTHHIGIEWQGVEVRVVPKLHRVIRRQPMPPLQKSPRVPVAIPQARAFTATRARSPAPDRILRRSS